MRDHRESKTCANQQTILASLLEEHFIAALSANLKSEGSREELVQALYSHLRLVTAAAAKRQAEASDQRQAIASKQKTVSRQIENVMAAVRDFAHSRLLLSELAGLEAQLDLLEAAMAATSAKPIEDVSEAEVRIFLKDAMGRVGDILLGNPEKFATNCRKGSRP